AADPTSSVGLALTAYLSAVPALLRQLLRRPGDPTGTSLPPGIVLQKAEDLLLFVPPRRPRFQPGDRPTGIGDLDMVELLSIDGVGEVWKARHPYLACQPPVTLKFCTDPALKDWLGQEAERYNRWLRQGKLPGLVRLTHTYLH